MTDFPALGPLDYAAQLDPFFLSLQPPAAVAWSRLHRRRALSPRLPRPLRSCKNDAAAPPYPLPFHIELSSPRVAYRTKIVSRHGMALTNRALAASLRFVPIKRAP
jgi:hypothetical protein